VRPPDPTLEAWFRTPRTRDAMTHSSGARNQVATDLEQTLAAMAIHKWPLALCLPRSKRPGARGVTTTWPVTDDPDRVRHHVAVESGNIGVCTGSVARLAILDPDVPAAWERLVALLGFPGPAWVRTGRGALHYYTAWEPHLPPKLRSLDGAVIGEVQRGGHDGRGQQHCLIPPSIHPDTGEPYTWLLDPAREAPCALAAPWRRWLWAEAIAARPRMPLRGDGAWRAGGDAAPILARLGSLSGPGPDRFAVRRGGGYWKFRCPQCQEDGHDLSRDNGVYFEDSRKFGCAFAGRDPIEGPRHRAAIWRLLSGS
jgi:hypothetical protein